MFKPTHKQEEHQIRSSNNMKTWVKGRHIKKAQTSYRSECKWYQPDMEYRGY